MIPGGPGIEAWAWTLGVGAWCSCTVRATSPSLWWWMWAGMAWRRVWWGRCAFTSQVMPSSVAPVLLGRIWCCLGVLLAVVRLLTLCAWRQRTWLHGRMFTAPPSRTCYATGIPVLWAARSCLSTSQRPITISGCGSVGERVRVWRAVAPWGGRGVPRLPSHTHQVHLITRSAVCWCCRPRVRRVSSAVVDSRHIRTVSVRNGLHHLFSTLQQGTAANPW